MDAIKSYDTPKQVVAIENGNFLTKGKTYTALGETMMPNKEGFMKEVYFIEEDDDSASRRPFFKFRFKEV